MKGAVYLYDILSILRLSIKHSNIVILTINYIELILNKLVYTTS